MTFFSVLFAASASVFTISFAVSSIATSLKKDKIYFFSERTRRNGRIGLMLLYLVCISSLTAYLLEELIPMYSSIIVIDSQTYSTLKVAASAILSFLFMLGLGALGLCAEEFRRAMA